MAVVDVKTKEEFDRLISGSTRCAVHFWASWCEPCVFMDTVFAQLAAENPSQKFLRVEAEEVSEVSEACEVSAVPFFLFFENGKVVDKLSGASAPELTAKVSQQTAQVSTARSVPGGGVEGASNGHIADNKPAKEERLQNLVNSHETMLFMKGTPAEPRCGFSAKVVAVLQKEGATFATFDILTDQDVRQGMKDFSDWPTFPQLYHKGEFVGGCDIVLEMSKNGELKSLLQTGQANGA